MVHTTASDFIQGLKRYMSTQQEKRIRKSETLEQALVDDMIAHGYDPRIDRDVDEYWATRLS